MISKQYLEKQFLLDKELKREHKETKEHKDVKDKDKDKDKDHKEIRKEEVLEYPQTHYPVADPGPELAAAQPAMQFGKTIEHKQINDKYIHKEIKQEIKEYKHEIKEYFEKWQYEGKVIYEGPVDTGPVGDPLTQRLTALESAVTQLLHFIPAELRPDLSQGALKQEPDAEKKSEPDPGKGHKK
jgi:hypothetical protein